ncbi:hypothetical protein KCV01_g9709, partial [Aureobasidium melanogenum]
MRAHGLSLDRQGPDPLVRNILRLRYRAHAQATDDRLAQRFAAADLHRHRRRQAPLLQRGFQHAPGRGAGLAHQQGLAAELLQRDRLPFRPAMGAVDEGDHRVGLIRPHVVALVRRHLGDHTDVAAVVRQVVQHLLGIAQRHRDEHMRMARMVGGDHAGDVERADRADLQRAVPQAAAVLQQEPGIVLQADHAPGQVEEFPAHRGQLHATPPPMEKLDAVLLFERLDLRGHRRLAGAHGPGGRGEAAMAIHGKKAA